VATSLRNKAKTLGFDWWAVGVEILLTL
jgi:hypothetical protein